MQHWIYQEQPYTEISDDDLEGFVYLITNNQTGKKYIGKKSFWSRRKQKKTGRRKTAESDWRDYYSSSDDVKADIKELGTDAFTREILHLCYYKKALAYYELKEQWERDVLLTDGYYNTNIAGKFFATERHLYVGSKTK